MQNRLQRLFSRSRHWHGRVEEATIGMAILASRSPRCIILNPSERMESTELVIGPGLHTNKFTQPSWLDTNKPEKRQRNKTWNHTRSSMMTWVDPSHFLTWPCCYNRGTSWSLNQTGGKKHCKCNFNVLLFYTFQQGLWGKHTHTLLQSLYLIFQNLSLMFVVQFDNFAEF